MSRQVGLNLGANAVITNGRVSHMLKFRENRQNPFGCYFVSPIHSSTEMCNSTVRFVALELFNIFCGYRGIAGSLLIRELL